MRKPALCCRCPVGREKRVKQQLRLGLEGTRWVLGLCDEHAAALERDLYSWARLGEQVLDEEGIKIKEGYIDEARRLAELRHKQSQPAFRIVVTDEDEEEVVPDVVPEEKERAPERFGDQVRVVQTQEE